MDLIMVASVGYLAPNDAGRVLGSVFVKELINRYVLTHAKTSPVNACARFSNAGGEVQPLYLEFGHDATIVAAMAAMDLNRYISILIVRELRFIYPSAEMNPHCLQKNCASTEGSEHRIKLLLLPR
jgi:hypothetical protein